MQAIEATRNGKPMIKLVYFRANNKFSYTSPSDDSMLRNLELYVRCIDLCHGAIMWT